MVTKEEKLELLAELEDAIDALEPLLDQLEEALTEVEDGPLELIAEEECK